MSQSNDEKVMQQVNLLLEHENQRMSAKVEADINRARIQALRQAEIGRTTKHFTWFKSASFLAAPLALSAILVIVNFTANDTLPALPTNFYAQDVPTEDFAMLEELEFASWLAEQQEALY